MTVSNQHMSTRRILIVDDIENNCLVIENHLRPQLMAQKWHIFEIAKKSILCKPLVKLAHQTGLEPVTY